MALPGQRGCRLPRGMTGRDDKLSLQLIHDPAGRAAVSRESRRTECQCCRTLRMNPWFTVTSCPPPAHRICTAPDRVGPVFASTVSPTTPALPNGGSGGSTGKWSHETCSRNERGCHSRAGAFRERENSGPGRSERPGPRGRDGRPEGRPLLPSRGASGLFGADQRVLNDRRVCGSAAPRKRNSRASRAALSGRWVSESDVPTGVAAGRPQRKPR